MPTNLIEGRANKGGIARIGIQTRDRLCAHVLKTGDIIYGRRGDIGLLCIFAANGVFLGGHLPAAHLTLADA